VNLKDLEKHLYEVSLTRIKEQVDEKRSIIGTQLSVDKLGPTVFHKRLIAKVDTNALF
jgi:hypothetical protein